MRVLFLAWMGALMACGDAHEPSFTEPLAAGWTVRRDGGEPMAAMVPGTVQGDLVLNGLATDPFIGDGIENIAWVARETWDYQLEFVVRSAWWAKENLDLVFNGIDTHAEIYLNDSLLGTTANMFRSWRFPVKHLLQAGPNRLVVRLLPVEELALARMERHGHILPADNDHGAPPLSPFVRKAGYHFGWDFAPRLLATGIWRPVELHGWDAARIASLRIITGSFSDIAKVEVEQEIVAMRQGKARIKLFLDDDPVAAQDIDLVPGRQTIRMHIAVPDPIHWWPNGAGGQHLYDMRAELAFEGPVVDVQEERFGLREVVLRQEPDSMGTSFHFEVNGKPIFMKGANVVPPDMLLPRAGDDGWLALVAMAQAAGMNMLRVWGGGVYPPDAFYAACDTAGILVWQDLMFANAMYPGGDEFQMDAVAEVQEQVERLRNHPSLALWCGNNEIEVAWNNWGWQQTYGIDTMEGKRMWKDHVRLFHELIPQRLAEMDGRPYTPTSPLSNWGNKEGLRHGSLHYWGVWHGDEDLTAFASNVGRFVSEYGFQSYPSMELLARYARSGDLGTGSGFWRGRQRSYKGDRGIQEMAERHGWVIDDRKDLVHASQSLQAEGYGLAIRAHRLAAPHCMGSLFWQLNDVWPGASWSVLDHAGGLKPAYHEVRRAFSDTLLHIVQERDSLRIIALVQQGLLESPVHLRLFHADGRTLRIGTKNLHQTAPDRYEATIPLEHWTGKDNKKDLVLFADLGPDERPGVLQTTFRWTVSGSFRQREADIRVKTVGRDAVCLTSAVPLLAVQVNVTEGVPKNDHFPMAPDREYLVRVLRLDGSKTRVSCAPAPVHRVHEENAPRWSGTAVPEE